jgi:hypothetical protein
MFEGSVWRWRGEAPLRPPFLPPRKCSPFPCTRASAEIGHVTSTTLESNSQAHLQQRVGVAVVPGVHVYKINKLTEAKIYRRRERVRTIWRL